MSAKLYRAAGERVGRAASIDQTSLTARFPRRQRRVDNPTAADDVAAAARPLTT